MAGLDVRVLSAPLVERIAGGFWAWPPAMPSVRPSSSSPPARSAAGTAPTEITGGGAFGWRPGEGTDDTDLAVAVARACAEGYSLDCVGRHFLAWYRSGPRDIGGTTRAALAELDRSGDPATSGPTWPGGR